MNINLSSVSLLNGAVYNILYWVLILVGALIIIGMFGVIIYYYLQATKYDVIAYIKRKGTRGYKKDKLRYFRTDDGEICKLLKTKAIIHPEKVKPFIQFSEKHKKPIVFLYTEDMKEFYPLVEEDYTIKKKIKYDGKDVVVEAKGLNNIVFTDDRMIRLHAFEEIKRSFDRSTIENPLKPLMKFMGYAAIGVFMLISLMVITNTLKDFSKQMVEMTKENNKQNVEVLERTQVIYNATEMLLEKQQDYVRELRRLSDAVSKVVEASKNVQETTQQE